MVDLIVRDLTFCHCFLSSDTRKLTAMMMFSWRSASDISTLPIEVLRHMTFLSWNLTVERISRIFSASESSFEMTVGNLPALFRPGPSRRGICLMRLSEARNASYLAASSLTSFLSRLKFLRRSSDSESMPRAAAASQCLTLPSTQIFMFGFIMWLRRIWPLKRLSLRVS
eukprot:Amastigsp_a508340_48937.p3 type:complete len:170 gc:universal Amastigsp_a508340_48937:658-149(-)